ncbi:MAG TPA: T9SS type A sorting domain-containing protein [Bacteroidia bacterium]|nr:T9SS type A sorting domain-containing protein [Bacteroidia bacterium]
MKKSTFRFIIALAFFPLFSIGQGGLKVTINGQDAKCNGNNNGSAIASVSGGSLPYTYNWAPSGCTDSAAVNLVAGTYTLTVTDNNGITARSTIIINEPSPLLVSIDSIVVYPCYLLTGPGGGGGSCGCNNTLWAIVNGGTAPYSYAWTPSGNTKDTLHNACYEEFAVAVTDKNQCVTSDSIFVAIPKKTTGINELLSPNDVKVYPVPTSNTLNIQINPLAANTEKLEVYDIMGKMLIEQKLKENTSEISLNTASLPVGNYLLRLVGDNTQLISHFSISR